MIHTKLNHRFGVIWLCLYLMHVHPGADIASGPVWMEYIAFLKSLPVCWILPSSFLHVMIAPWVEWHKAVIPFTFLLLSFSFSMLIVRWSHRLKTLRKSRKGWLLLGKYTKKLFLILLITLNNFGRTMRTSKTLLAVNW